MDVKEAIDFARKKLFDDTTTEKEKDFLVWADFALSKMAEISVTSIPVTYDEFTRVTTDLREYLREHLFVKIK